MVSTAEEGAGPPPSDIIDPARSVRTTLRGIATLVAPTSLVTGLLFYFGWARANRQSTAMGFDLSLLGYSSQEYVLLSLKPMFWPLLVGLLLAIGGLLLHGAILLYASGSARPSELPRREQRRRQVRRLGIGLGGVGVVLAVLGLVGSGVDHPGRLVSIGFPLCLTGSIVCGSYAIYLSQRFRGSGRRRRLTPELRAVQVGLSALVVLLLLLTLFWSVSNYAENKGADAAILIDENLRSLPDVTIYSAKRLYLPVAEEPLPGENGAYRFRYTGLKLLFRNKSSYFLRPAAETGVQLNIVLAESPDVRFEFSKPR